jgi:hypothetical protein
MTWRYSGITNRQIDREFRHQVAIDAAGGGLGLRILEMNDFCRENAMIYRTQTDHRKGGDFIRYCFADPAHADTFAGKFRGERSSVVPHDRP